MAGTNLQNILGGRTLTKAVQSVKPGIPFKHLPPALFQVTDRVIGNQFEYRQYTGTRRTPSMVMYEGPSVRRTPLGLTMKQVTLAQFHNNLEFKPATLLNLLDDNETRQEMGIFEVQRIIEDSNTELDNGRATAIMSMLALNKSYFDANGNMLPSSSGATVTVDYNVPAGNKNQLAIDGGSAVLTASWANAGTDIISQLVNFKLRASMFNNYIPEVAFYGSAIPGLLAKNDAIQAYAEGNPAYQTAFLSGEIPNGFMGFTWIPAYMSYLMGVPTAAAPNGVASAVFPSDQITFTPQISNEWYGLAEGTKLIPEGFADVKPDAATVIKGLRSQFGKFAFAYMDKPDPITVIYDYGDTYLPFLRVPDAVYSADVVF